ncbi:hypothetical protein [Ferviditalea candida]|uniref:Uncharacterized protein n=1 Tax=Ferviditalea candida TaxID=3108399 RepID=A0ABU5ZFS7_9BACL|nr:hypothetical protein [Paenibacillaceae bacterium T2]
MMWEANVLMFGKVLFSFLVLFVFLPSLIIRFQNEDDSVLDRIFIPLIHSSVFIIIAVHILAAFLLFEPISIIAACVSGFLFFWRRRLVRSSQPARAH